MKRSLFTFLFSFIYINASYALNYLEVFPTYFEYCGATQIHYRNGDKGGPGGHGFMYIEGLCRDENAEIPQVRPCREMNAEHTGVGISLDSDFVTYPWVAIPGRELMLFGNKKPEDEINLVSMEELAWDGTQMGLFKNLKVKKGIIPSSIKEGSRRYEKEVARFSIGTNIAANWGRRLSCIRIPIPKSAIASIASYLNGVNNHYYSEKIDYEWDMVFNNCTHLVLNAMSQIGLNRPIKIDRPWKEQIFNIAVPMNALWLYQEIGNFGPWSLYELKKNQHTRKLFETTGWIPTGVGALNATYEIPKRNKVFHTEDLHVIAIPRMSSLIPSLPYAIEKISKNYFMRKESFENPNYRDLKANLVYWKKNYKEALDFYKNDETVLGRKYRSYLKEQISFIEKKIKGIQ